MSDDFEALARAAFVEEADLMLTQFEQSISSMAQPQPHADTFKQLANAAFRAVHTIKGSAGIFAMHQLTHLAHQAESLLDVLRQQPQQLHATIEAVLLQVHDELHRLFAEPDAQASTNLLAQLDVLIEADGVVSSDAEVAVQVVAAASPPFATVATVDAAATLAAQHAHAPVPHQASRPRDKDGGPKIRVEAQRIDSLIENLSDISSQMTLARSHASDDEHIDHLQQMLNRTREQALSLRMVPMSDVFSRFPRLVRDIAQKLGKDIELLIHEGDAEIDRAIVEAIIDPITHMLRNSMDHGIEPAADRVRQGKPAKGHIVLSCERDAGQLVIQIQDDGQGLNQDRIRQRAIERGLISAQAVLTSEEVLQLICMPGFSTAAQVTEVSGRGVGMDVVKRNIEALRGELRIASQVGRGTTLQIRVPMTLALMSVFVVHVGACVVAIAHDAVAECLDWHQSTDSLLQPTGSFMCRGQLLSYVSLGHLFDASFSAAASTPSRPARLHVVVCRTATGLLGLVVDVLQGSQDIVARSLGAMFASLQLFNGATVLTNGTTVPILDVNALHRLVTPSTLVQPAISANALATVKPFSGNLTS